MSTHTVNHMISVRSNIFQKMKMIIYSIHLGSIMHYKWNAFSKNGQATITSKTGLASSLLGSSKVMTDYDIQIVKAYYGCA